MRKGRYNYEVAPWLFTSPVGYYEEESTWESDTACSITQEGVRRTREAAGGRGRSDDIPYANFISYLLMESWRYDHVAIMDDSKDFDCHRMFGSRYEDRSVDLWNEFIMIMGWQFKDLRSL